MVSVRPHVIVSTTASADGRVTLSRAERLLEEGPNHTWRASWPPDTEEVLARRAAATERGHHQTVVLEGSGTFVADDAGPLALPHTDLDPDELRTDFLPRRSVRWFAVVDGRGRVPWTHQGDAETSLLVLTSRSTPLRYLAYLRREQIPYLVVGDEQVDLSTALVKIRELLGATCVVSEGGGGLNGALFDAGLVDELHVVTIPSLVGGLDTPSIMDGPRTTAWLRTHQAADRRRPGRRARHHLGALRRRHSVMKRGETPTNAREPATIPLPTR